MQAESDQAISRDQATKLPAARAKIRKRHHRGWPRRLAQYAKERRPSSFAVVDGRRKDAVANVVVKAMVGVSLREMAKHVRRRATEI